MAAELWPFATFLSPRQINDCLTSQPAPDVACKINIVASKFQDATSHVFLWGVSKAALVGQEAVAL